MTRAPTADVPAVDEPRAWWWVPVVVAGVAFALRLTPVLRGGGLWGLLGYDGGVYYTAAAGLAHGLLPYRDFLLLHPPGSTLALLPFGLLGRAIGDPDAMALARLAWMGLGALSAVLVTAVLRRSGRAAALTGGLFYAGYVPAIYVERTTALEALSGTCTLAAVLLLTRAAPRTSDRLVLAAGALLGFSTATKIWGIAVLAAVLVWCAFVHGRRRALLAGVGSAAALVLVCLPFFLAAPVRMWRMVVEAQLGRPRVPVDLATKVVDVAGLTEVGLRDKTGLLALVAAVGVAALVLALRTREGRLAAVLLAVGLGLLGSSPAWSTDYASLVGGPLALLLGAGVGVAAARLAGRARARAVLVAAALTGVLGCTAASAPGTTFGPAFPGRSLGRLLAGTPGCVTTDDPTALVEADLLQRNLARGCPLVADLGGYSYYLQPGAALHVGRARNEQWQRFTLDYLSSGEASVVVRFAHNVGLSRATRSTIEEWPLIGMAGPWEVRRPTR